MSEAAYRRGQSLANTCMLLSKGTPRTRARTHASFLVRPAKHIHTPLSTHISPLFTQMASEIKNKMAKEGGNLIFK